MTKRKPGAKIGRPVGSRSPEMLEKAGFRLSAESIAELDDAAREVGTTPSAVLRGILAGWVKRRRARLERKS
jgi:hypothetical protein